MSVMDDNRAEGFRIRDMAVATSMIRTVRPRLASAFSPLSFLLGISCTIAAPVVWDGVLLPLVRALGGMTMLPDGPLSLSPWSAAGAVLLLGGAAAALLVRSPVRRDLTPWGEGEHDLGALHRRRFHVLSALREDDGPLDARQWLRRTTLAIAGDDLPLSGPWTDERIVAALERGLSGRFVGTTSEKPIRMVLHRVFALHAWKDPRARAMLAALASVSASGSTFDALVHRMALDAMRDGVTGQILAHLEERHAWSETALMGSLAEARRAGVLPTSEFGWLKHRDRAAFYALDALGRTDAAHPEGAAAACQYAEEVRTGHALPEPCLGRAVQGVRQSLARLEAAD